MERPSPAPALAAPSSELEQVLRRLSHELIAREAEVAQMGRLFTPTGPVALVIEGEAGIGKTAMWRAGLEMARAAGFTVLACQPAEREQALPFAALGDLLEPVLDDARGMLADPQRMALDTALLRVTPTEPQERLAVSRAAVALLRAVVLREPTLVAIDDVQWLDPASEDVVQFAARRLAGLPVRFLVARRSTATQPAPLALSRTYEAGRLEMLRLGPLSIGGLDRVLRTHLDLRLARPRLAELHRRTGGNPFYALEFGRALKRPDNQGLRVPESLGALVRDRLDTLTPAGREATLLAAASSVPQSATIVRVAGGAEGLAEAVRASVLVLERDRVRFSHPLLASVAYDAAIPSERQAIHARLAAAATDAEERARHLALATEEPDEAVAAELEEAARIAANRGAPEAAAELLEHAVRLTAAGRAEDRRRRLSAAAEHHVASGDPEIGREIYRRLVHELPPGLERAEALWRLADSGRIGFDDSIRLAEQALEEAGGEPAVSARIHTALGVFTWLNGDLQRSLRHCREAAACAERAGDDLLVAITLGEVAHAETVLGLPVPETEIARALALEGRLGDFPSYLRPSFQLGVIRMVTDRPDEARPLFEAELRRITAVGDESARCGVLFRLAELELRAGIWDRAVRYAEESKALALQAGIEQEQSATLMIHGLVQAHVGNVDEARQAAETAIALTEETGDRVIWVRAKGVLGFVALSEGDPLAAVEQLEPATRELRRLGTGELSISQVVQNEIEALVALGRLEEAEETIALVDEKGRPTGRVWHQAIVARGRALVASARGDMESANEHVALALAAHERLPQPFELGRTLLAQGAIERRAKRRAAARAAHTQALELFDRIGAPLWAEKAAAELARIPGRPPASDELSETERRVAALIASGLSNKEVAARLFVTIRTVEGNLTRIYGKLGIRSRTELAARLGREQAPPPSQ